MPRTVAILPVKRFADAKQRLGASLADPLRARLAHAMVLDVLDALARVEAVEHTLVVSDEPAVVEAAAERGAGSVADEPASGQSAAVAHGVAHALRAGFERALCVPGDSPALDPDELAALLADEATREGVVIVPDRHGTGTNGLLLTPPGAIAPSFGPGSCARHHELARAAGVPVRLAPLRSLVLDIDTGADLAVLRERLAAESSRAGHTRALLAEAARAAELPATSAA